MGTLVYRQVIFVCCSLFWLVIVVLRISELLSMKTNHIQIMPEGMSVFLPTRKNDQFRAADTIHIARTGKPTCPVVITERLLEALPGGRNGCLPVVRRLKRVRGLQTFHESRGISYTTAKDLLKRKLGFFFDDLRHLGTHSLGSGGISDPGCANLSDIALQAHGGWKCVESKNKYIKPSAEALFTVSSSLSI